MHRNRSSCIVLALLASAAVPAMAAQPPAPDAAASCRTSGFLPGPARFSSVETGSDGRLTFRICAPDATDVRVTSSDMAEAIPFGRGGPAGLAMTKDATGLWSGTTSVPVAPDNYRYSFSVNGVTVPDPATTTFSRERVGTQSTLEVPGAAGKFQSYDAAVAHGVVSEFEYWYFVPEGNTSPLSATNESSWTGGGATSSDASGLPATCIR